MSETVSSPPKRSRRGLIVFALILLVLIALVVAHLLTRKKPAHESAPIVVTVTRATLGSIPVTLSELGTVTPTATVTVLPQLSGYLTEVGYHEGQEVQKGQFLAQIDPRQYQISKQQAQATLAKDRASLAQARADLERYTQLNERKSIAQQTFADQQFLVQQDEAAVKADLANIAQYDLDLAYCRITAPIAGKVGLRLVDPGNYVTASSSTGIVVITTVKPTTVQFTVPQDALASIVQRLNTGAKLPVTAYSSDNAREIATGTLYAVSNQMATATGTVTLRATFANDDEALFPNEFVNVKLLVDTMQNAVLVPTAAVQTGAPGDFVYLVNPNSTVSVHKVKLGPSDGKSTVILSGLAVGNEVVTDGTDRLNDGAKIQPAHPQPAAAGSASGTNGASGAAGETGASASAAKAPAAASEPAPASHAAASAVAAS
ncbi:efflux RND transporter periplasmic adaptor subunit [Paraburkholderia antibiotica]|uniref:Efflux RND transporter periplasmic adaptor subunit n=1 Tax=Paraburkholderia antibiotica TaxID=2728839 RepID=A0A7X9ZY63_9BURK|nr:efflux RND transporter periplasmic adaptor subunit [Paraburkholderia antibiotica]NML32586.1 efflux RND transporter periplasmic adaptor subunit [Paraburkholderia antibiotica]